MLPEPDLLRDRCCGSLLWGAVGDALGRAVEGAAPASCRARHGPQGLKDYEPWRGWRGGPKGTITDDTQLTMELAASLLANGGTLDPADFAQRLVAWLPVGRGKGRATTEAVLVLQAGVPWWRAGVRSDGNGAAMRAAPIGLAHALDRSPAELRRQAVLSALPTHTGAVGVAAAVALAAGVAWCLREALRGAAALNAGGFLAFVVAAIADIEETPVAERKPGGSAVFLRDRLAEVAYLAMHADPEVAFAHTWNGAFALESLPAAFYCLLHSANDPREVIRVAVNGGQDADTVASMAGNLVGAWCGAERLRDEAPRWWDDLEYREDLLRLGKGLAQLSARG